MYIYIYIYVHVCILCIYIHIYIYIFFHLFPEDYFNNMKLLLAMMWICGFRKKCFLLFLNTLYNM